MNHQDLLVNAGPGGVSAEMIHKLSFCPEQIFDKELCTYYAHPRGGFKLFYSVWYFALKARGVPTQLVFT